MVSTHIPKRQEIRTANVGVKGTNLPNTLLIKIKNFNIVHDPEPASTIGNFHLVLK